MQDNVLVYVDILPCSQHGDNTKVDLIESLLMTLHSQEGITSEYLAGSKSAAAIGTILAKIIEAVGVQNFVNVIIGWLKRDPSRCIKLNIDGHIIELSDPTAEERKRLIEIFQQHTSLVIVPKP